MTKKTGKPKGRPKKEVREKADLLPPKNGAQKIEETKTEPIKTNEETLDLSKKEEKTQEKPPEHEFSCQNCKTPFNGRLKFCANCGLEFNWQGY